MKISDMTKTSDAVEILKSRYQRNWIQRKFAKIRIFFKNLYLIIKD